MPVKPPRQRTSRESRESRERQERRDRIRLQVASGELTITKASSAQVEQWRQEREQRQAAIAASNGKSSKPSRRGKSKPNVRSDGNELVAAVIELSDDDEADDMTT
jgi:hypothetical protein